MKWGFGRGVPGAQLTSDLPAKAITAVASWKKFYSFMGMANFEFECSVDGGISPQVVGAVVSAIAALGVVASSPKVAKMSKVASAVGLAALVAWLARKVGPEGFKNTARKDPNKIQSKGTLGHPAAVAELGAARNPVKKRYQRENEPWPREHGVRENEPTPGPGVRESEPTSVNSSLHGSQVARLAVSNSYGW